MGRDGNTEGEDRLNCRLSEDNSERPDWEAYWGFAGGGMSARRGKQAEEPG